MKRILALALSLILAFSLCACGVEPSETGETPNFTEAPDVTLPDGSTVYSEEPFVEFPQTGEYKETALLTNVPGQGVPLLLDMREDGTIDYIFGTSTRGFTNHYDDSGVPTLSFKENGVKYYTIAPDGTATLHDESWIDQIDNYVEMTNTAANIETGKWEFTFAAEEGTILILGQFGPNLYTLSEILVTVLFKIQNDMVTIVPINYHLEYDGNPVDWSTSSIGEMRLENGYVFFEGASLSMPINGSNSVLLAAFHLNGTLSDMIAVDWETLMGEWTGQGYTGTVQYVDSNGKICIELYTKPTVPPYTDDDLLYNLGKFIVAPGRKPGHMDMISYDANGNFCCWFDQGGQGMLIRYDHNPEGAIEPEVLTVWSLEPINLIKTAVVEWNHTHASPIFRYVTAAEELEGTNLTQEDYMTRLNLELLNNQGPDVMILDGLNVEKYMDFMAPLDSLNTAGVYENILERFTVSGDLMALPARAVPYLLGRQTEGTQQIQSLTQFADMITTATGVLDVPNYDMIELYYDYVNGAAPYYVNNYNQVFRLWYPAWADAIWEDGKLNREVFVDFLTQTTRLVDHYTLGEPGVHEGIHTPIDHESTDTAYIPTMDETDFHDDRHQALYTLAAPGYVGLETYWYQDYSMRNNGPVYPHYIEHIPGPDGTGAMVPTVITGVRAGGHEEAGLEFVQLLLSREMQLGWTYHGSPDPGYPVIWEYVEDLIQKDEIDKRQECAVENDYEETITNLRTVIIDEYLFEAALIAARSCYRTEDRLTPEEAAEALYEATRIYLAEQR